MSMTSETRYRWLILGGVAVGAAVFGLGSRIAIRFVGILASPEHLRQPTAFGVVGKVTFAGTAGLVVLGVAGLFTGLAYLVIRPWLPGGWALRGLALGVLLLSPVAVFIVASSRSDLDLTSTTAISAAFGLMMLIEGLATAWVLERLGRSFLPPPLPRALGYWCSERSCRSDSSGSAPR